jgi:hypothetical protein
LAEIPDDGSIWVVAAAGDPAAGRLLEQWPPGVARAMTPATIAACAWQWSLGADGTVAWQVRDALGAPPGVRGIVNLLEQVRPCDLPQFQPAERSYVAAELTAFLHAWLHTLDCRKLNPPSLSTLNGELSELTWRAQAMRCGMLVTAYSTDDGLCASSEQPADATITVSVIGRRTVGMRHARLLDAALALRECTRLPMLQLTCRDTPEGLVFCRATVRPDFSDETVSDAVRAYFAESRS